MDQHIVENQSKEQESANEPATAYPPEQPSVEDTTVEKTARETLTHLELPAAVPQKHNRKLLVSTLVVALVVILGAGGFFAYKTLHKSKLTAAVTPLAAQPKKSQPSSSPAPVADATFLQTAQETSDLHFFKSLGFFGISCDGNAGDTSNCTTPLYKESDLHYYKVGKTADGNTIVDVVATSGGEMGGIDYLAIESSPDHYGILGSESGMLQRRSDESDSDYRSELTKFSAILSSNITLDMTTALSSLDFPKSATIKGATMAAGWTTYDTGSPHVGTIMPNGLADIRGQYFGAMAKGTTPVKLGSSEGKDFYEVTAEDQPLYSVKEYYGTINQVFSAQYIMSDPLSPLTTTDPAPTLAATWSQGSATKAAYQTRAATCGAIYDYMIPKGVTKDQLTVVGTGPDGQTLYELPTSSPLLKEYYTDYDGGQWLTDKSLQKLSLSGFQAQHAVIVAENPLGELAIYQRNDMFTGGGCGKPVIYLYPKTTTKVNIQVGADVTKSEPRYAANGWQDVVAQPNGNLTYQGKAYGSLFWEGFGQGEYPLVQNTGTVIPKDQAVNTIRTQLAEQGFTTKEISDFLAFWQPKLPNTPYVRLTWLGTASMNEVAPLHISPRPDTVIRTFLDFEGLQTPENLQPQHFVAPARNGFTVVEWGGLLRDGSIRQ